MRWSMIVALSLLSACNSGDPASDQASDAAAEATDPVSDASPASLDEGPGMPAAMQGRWGLVPADCEFGRADAKGLMVVDDDSLEFYESVAQLDEATERSGQTVRATFNFTGEGMTWERDMTLTLGETGDTLVRREFGDDAAPDPFEYTRCG